MRFAYAVVMVGCAGKAGDSNSDAVDAATAGSEQSAPTPPDGGEWGDEIEAAPEFFAASDVPASQVDLLRRDHATASEVWGNFGPLEFWVVGTDEAAAEALDAEFCALRQERDASLPSNFQEMCLGRDYGFVEYARNGGAGLNTRHNEREEYAGFLVTMASKNPYPDEIDYTTVTYHEYFHVVQMAHIASEDEEEQRRLMVENPWWSEGGAEYMAQLLQSRQPGVGSDYLKERMAWKMDTKSMLDEGERFSDIPYGERARIGYDLGAWFIAFLVHQAGEDAYKVGFFDDLNAMGWEGAFESNFGMTSERSLDDFEGFLALPLDEQLDIIP